MRGWDYERWQREERALLAAHPALSSFQIVNALADKRRKLAELYSETLPASAAVWGKTADPTPRPTEKAAIRLWRSKIRHGETGAASVVYQDWRGVRVITHHA